MKHDDDAGAHVDPNLRRKVPLGARGIPVVGHRPVQRHLVAGHQVEPPVGEGRLGPPPLPLSRQRHRRPVRPRAPVKLPPQLRHHPLLGLRRESAHAVEAVLVEALEHVAVLGQVLDWMF